ncbi:uncharacterized protein DUF4328 [Kribbella amoyensis]|uniref:Uncharacterized protein DUF4328 n=1 Tax=Kribbella amoyensis TaxID=996641 RepID=A0A561BP29_9ACTN|nr:DUF4328 domain-containing protein [Kribbella amoyensis]TWD80628.1 uncharacterized protein DUF4328 [Kribbella amoyensis]
MTGPTAADPSGRPGAEQRPAGGGDLPSYQPDSYLAHRYQPPPLQIPSYQPNAYDGPPTVPPTGAAQVPGPGDQDPAKPPQPPLDRWFTSEQAMGLGASILIGLVTVMSWATAWSDWHSYRIVEAVRDDQDKLDQADLIAGSFGIVAALALAAAAAVFIVWLWRVRWNAEMFCRGEHRLTRGWVLGSWICPVLNLWYPKQVVDDIVAASDPRTSPHVTTLRGIPGTRLVWAWWLTWVVGLVLDNVTQRTVLDQDTDLGTLLQNGILSSISAVSTTAAAVLAVLLIQRVNDLQMRRPWTPWWAFEPSPEPPVR